MNYRCGNDALSSSKLNELIHLNVTAATKLFNGTMKNVTDPDSSCLQSINDLNEQIQIKSNLSGKINNDCHELGINNQKLKFSEKLKVLLKNGSNKGEKLELNDPYAFSELDSQYDVTCDQDLNDVDTLVETSSPSSIKSNNVQPQKSIIFPKLVVPKLLVNSSGVKDEYSSEIKNSFCKDMKLAKISVPVYSSNNPFITNVNQTSYKVSGACNSDKFKISNSRNAKTIAPHFSVNTKNFLGKAIGKPMQNVKPQTNMNNLKINKNNAGKPHSYGQSQLFRHSSLKPERKLENKSKNFAKGKSLLNQIQKTVSLSRSIGKPRKIPSKPTLPTSGKSNSIHPELPFSTNLNNRNFSKRSLLEESLLGLKNGNSGSSKELININPSKQRNVSTNNVKFNHSQETGTSAYLIPSRTQSNSAIHGKKESLQRIWSVRNKLNVLKRDHHHFGLTINDVEYENTSNSESLLFQNYWFSVSSDYDSLSYHDRKRDTKLSQLKVELRHKIKQLQWKYKDEYRDKVVELLVESARKQPNLTAFLLSLENSQYGNRKRFIRSKCSTLIRPMLCTYTNTETGQMCEEQAMPCVRYCPQHITCSDDQLLFTACVAIRSDNTACRAPVLDQDNENPLCLQHKRLQFMSDKPKKVNSNTKPVNKIAPTRKRSRSSTSGSSRSGRNRKRKRTHPKDRKEETGETFLITNNLSDSNHKFKTDKLDEETNDLLRCRNALIEINPQVVTKSEMDESQEVEVGEEVLAMAADLPLELANHATRLLEEHDFTNVLNHIPPDAFNDLFTEDKEKYEPTPQETEELERALEAVDNDVKSLEKLSQTQGILDALLDEHTIAQTLAQLPEVTANLEVPPTLVPVFYQNGFNNINQIEQTLHDVNKSLTQTVLLNQGTDVLNNHFNNNLAVSNHTDMLQS